MRSRDGRKEIEQPFDPGWPDSGLEVDDEAFAKAIAEGRGKKLAA